MRNSLYVGVLALTLSSCLTVQVVNDQKSYADGDMRRFTAFERRSFMLYMSMQAVEIDRFCKNGKWKSYKATKPAWSMFLSKISFGFYDPYSVAIECGK